MDHFAWHAWAILGPQCIEFWFEAKTVSSESTSSERLPSESQVIDSLGTELWFGHVARVCTCCGTGGVTFMAHENLLIKRFTAKSWTSASAAFMSCKNGGLCWRLAAGAPVTQTKRPSTSGGSGTRWTERRGEDSERFLCQWVARCEGWGECLTQEANAFSHATITTGHCGLLYPSKGTDVHARRRYGQGSNRLGIYWRGSATCFSTKLFWTRDRPFVSRATNTRSIFRRYGFPS